MYGNLSSSVKSICADKVAMNADNSACAASVGKDTLLYSNITACREMQTVLLRQCEGRLSSEARRAWSRLTAH